MDGKEEKQYEKRKRKKVEEMDTEVRIENKSRENRGKYNSKRKDMCSERERKKKSAKKVGEKRYCSRRREEERGEESPVERRIKEGHNRKRKKL